jgi:4a-hydroxytetrahydrobiopterin dehydratase
MKKLDIEQAEPIRKKFAPDWEIRKGRYLYKKVEFDDYNQMLSFLMAIEKPQVKLDHFADFMNFYNELTIAITTHDVNGLTQLDFELVLYVDDVLDKMGAKRV